MILAMTTSEPDKLPSTILCFFFIALMVLIAQAGLYFFTLLDSKQKLQQSNEVTGIMYGAISLLYSLILTFVIVAVWEDYEDLNNTIEKEADKIYSIMSHSTTLPPSLKTKLSDALYRYCDRVINEEWEMKEPEGLERPSAIPSLRQLLLTAKPQDKEQERIFNVIDEDLSSISDLRRNRLSHNKSQVPDLVWLMLKAGSVMMILFFYFFNVPTLKLKRIYLSFLTSCIGMCMFLVYTLDHPFNGSAQVSNRQYAEIQLELKKFYLVPYQ